MAATTDRARLQVAFDAHLDALQRYCLRRIAVDDVNDVVSEVFMVAWRKINQMPDGDETLPWLYRVAQLEINNRRRSRRRFSALKEKVSGLAPDSPAGPESTIVRNDELDHLMSALSQLRPEDQEVLLLRTYEDLDYSQMSVALACSPEAARKRLARALRRLRRAAGIPEPQGAASATRAIEEGGDE